MAFEYETTRADRLVDWCMDTTGLGYDAIADTGEWLYRWSVTRVVLNVVLVVLLLPIGALARVGRAVKGR